MSERGEAASRAKSASLFGLRGAGAVALPIAVGRHQRSQARPSGLGFALLAPASIERGRRADATFCDDRVEDADE